MNGCGCMCHVGSGTRTSCEHCWMAEVEARDARIASLTNGMQLWADRAEAAEQRARELETKLAEETARADRLVQEAIDAGDAEDAAERRVRELEEALESRAATWKARAEAEMAIYMYRGCALHAERRVRELKEALRDACDVAIWLSGLRCLRRDAWSHWESDARPKLYRAMGVLQREEKT